MNIAFEISPLLTASGVFGDRSGVYRYMFGLITSLKQILTAKNKNARIVLFSFNRSLLLNQLNHDLTNLLSDKTFVFLNNFAEFRGQPKIGSWIKRSSRKFVLLKFFLSIIDKLIHIKVLYNKAREYVHNRNYLCFLDRNFKKSKVKIIFHSETGFQSISGYKNIITVYDLTTLLFPNFHRSETIDLHSRKFNFVYDYVDGMICISKSTKKDLISFFPSFAEKKIIVIYPGLNQNVVTLNNSDDDLFNDLRSLIRTKQQSLVVKKYLLHYGTFEPRKNLFNLVRAFIDLQETKNIPSDFKLVLIGGTGWGNVKSTIIDYIEETFPNKKKRNIIILDFLSDKYLTFLIKKAYAVVYPSLYEGFGLPVLESMALGTPVICANNSSLPEVGDKAVLYFDTQNLQDFKEKIKLLVGNSRLAKELSKKGAKQSKKFTWKKSALKLYSFLETL